MPCREGSRARIAALALVVGLVSLAGCGEGSRMRVIARVGAVSIDEAEVAHWAQVAARGGSLGMEAQDSQTSRTRALRFLITTHWLLGEATARGAAVSRHAVDAELERQEASALGGAAELRQERSAVGMTRADAQLELRRELASAALAQIVSRAALSTRAELTHYYELHRARFRSPEERGVDLVEHIPSRAAAARLAPRLTAEPTSSPLWTYHETLSRPRTLDASSEKDTLVRAIFAAVPGRLYGPMRLSHRYAMFVVRTIKPYVLRPFSQVEQRVQRHLTALRRKRLAAAAYTRYRARWIARTSCSPRLLVAGCREYRGREASEANPFAGE